jgi:hypothetical protein
VRYVAFLECGKQRFSVIQIGIGEFGIVFFDGAGDRESFIGLFKIDFAALVADY